MNTAVCSLLLMACVAVCISAGPVIMDCQCLTTVKAIPPPLIARVFKRPPRPYCSKTEVIAVLKNGNQKCLDPNGTFARNALKVMQIINRKNTTRSKMTTAAATAAPTTTAPTTTSSTTTSSTP